MCTRRRNRGLSLLEVVLAASIMASVVALILTGYSRMAAAAKTAMEYRRATELLGLKLQEVYGLDDLNDLDREGDFADADLPGLALPGASWRIEVASRKTGLSQIKVTVSWRGGRGSESIDASTLKFLPGEIAGQ
jgi:type II secretory pathway pseudopilin PulG